MSALQKTRHQLIPDHLSQLDTYDKYSVTSLVYRMGLFEIITSFVLVGKNFKTNVFKLVGIDDAFDRWNRGFMVFISVLFGCAVLFHHWIFDVINCLDFQSPTIGYEQTDQMANFQRFAEEYCWAYGIYTVREAYDLENTPFPGIIPSGGPACMEMELFGGGRIICPDAEDIKPMKRIYLKWYPMVIFYFWVAAALYFFTWRVYKMCGLRKVKDVVLMLQNRPQFADDLPDYINRGAKWLDNTFSVFVENRNTIRGKIRRHWYFFLVASIKIVYLLISVGLVHYTNKLLYNNHTHGANFLIYGAQWLFDVSSNDTGAHSSIQNKLFPKMVACEVKRWGTSGLEEWQGMCVLAGNVMYQWLFLIYWICLVLSIVINLVGVVTCLSTELRVKASYQSFLNSTYVEDTESLRLIYENIGTSGRVILRIIGNNVNPKVCDELIIYMVQFMLGKEKEEDKERRMESARRRDTKYHIIPPNQYDD